MKKLSDAEVDKLLSAIVRDAETLVPVLKGAHPTPFSVPVIQTAKSLRDNLTKALEHEPLAREGDS